MNAQAHKSVKLVKDDVLLREGEVSDSMFWLQTGQLVATKFRPNGEEILLGHIYPGELVGEMSFLDKEPRSATIKALTDCELIEIPQEKYQQNFEGQPKWLQALVKTLLDRLRKANARIKV